MTERRTVPYNNLDLVWILLIVTLAVTIIRTPTTTQAAIEPKAEFIVDVSWDGDSCSDIDAWFRAPGGEKVWFGAKQNGIYHLDRDDLGCRNDLVADPATGGVKVVQVNSEVLTMRGAVAGEYRVNLHAYTFKDDGPIQAHVRVIKVNPFQIVVERTFPMTTYGQEVTAVVFRVDAAGAVAGLSYDFQPLTRNAVGIGGPN
jgi:hypothetical protein